MFKKRMLSVVIAVITVLSAAVTPVAAALSAVYAHDAEELEDAVESDTKVILDAAAYNFDCELYIDGVDNFSIEGAAGTKIVSEYGDDAVLAISDCVNVTISNISIGYNLPAGDECSEALLLIESCESVKFENCDIYGGLSCFNISESSVRFNNCVIRDSAESIGAALDSNIEFNNCVIKNNGAANTASGTAQYGEYDTYAFEIESWDDEFITLLTFNNCEFLKNNNNFFKSESSENSEGEFFEQSSYSVGLTRVNNCVFTGNTWQTGQIAAVEADTDTDMLPLRKNPSAAAEPSKNKPADKAPVNEQTDVLAGIFDVNSAVSAVQSAIAGMSAEAKQSPADIDYITLYAEEAIAQAASKAVSDGNVAISQSSLQAAQTTAKEAKTAIEQVFVLSGISLRRAMNADVKFKTQSQSAAIVIDSSAAGVTADNVRVETPVCRVSFSAKAIKECAADAPQTVKISTPSGSKITNVMFDKPMTQNIKLSLPPVSGDPAYQAISNSAGGIMGGKYNPVTNTLCAATKAAGAYMVKDNKKNISDIASKPAEMQDAINLLSAKGIFSGTSVTGFAFSPDAPITRAEIARMIMLSISELDPKADGGFSDVNPTDWFFGAAGSAKRHGVMTSTGGTKFEPRTVIPKNQIVCVAARVLRNEMKYRDPENVGDILSAYKDSGSLADWSLKDIALAARENLVTSQSGGAFNPSAPMTRGEAAVVLYRMYIRIW